MSPPCDGCGAVSVKFSVAFPVLPARSVWVAVSVCGRADTGGVKLQAPVPSEVVAPRMVPPSLIVTSVLAWPTPLTAGFDVMLSLDELPSSESRAMLSAGAILSSVKLSVAVPVLPATSIWVAVSVCAPSARPAGVKPQVPVLSTVVVPSRRAALLDGDHSTGLTRPLIAGFEVILSVAELPVSETEPCSPRAVVPWNCRA